MTVRALNCVSPELFDLVWGTFANHAAVFGARVLTGLYVSQRTLVMKLLQSTHRKAGEIPWMHSRLLIACAVILGGCTTESMYNTVQEVQLQRCEEQPIPMQEACKAQYELSYDDYARERAGLTQEDQ